MNLWNGKNLTPTFGEVATSENGFANKRRWSSVKNRFLDVTGLKANLAIDRDIIMPWFREILPLRYMTKMNVAGFLCALSIKHEHSKYDQVRFLYNFIDLYNAKTVQEVLAVEKVVDGSPEFVSLWSVYNKGNGSHTKRLEAVKIRCWALDLERATSSKGRIAIPSKNHQSITVEDVENLLKLYPSQPIKDNVEEEGPEFVEKLRESDGSYTNSAFPKDQYLPLLRNRRADGSLNEAQCVILLCFILHAREKRHDKKTSYVVHPMAVAGLVKELGAGYFKDEKELLWESVLIAPLHDGGEKSNIDLENDLKGLLPSGINSGVRGMHKADDEPYFIYLKRCADDIRDRLVKLCDGIHNMSDAGGSPTFKQAYVYPISINYCHYRLMHRDEDISVLHYMEKKNVCTDKLSPKELYLEISKIADDDLLKKMSAGKYRDRLGVIENIKTPQEIISEAKALITQEKQAHAHTRGKENPSPHP